MAKLKKSPPPLPPTNRRDQQTLPPECYTYSADTVLPLNNQIGTIDGAPISIAQIDIIDTALFSANQIGIMAPTLFLALTFFISLQLLLMSGIQLRKHWQRTGSLKGWPLVRYALAALNILLCPGMPLWSAEYCAFYLLNSTGLSWVMWAAAVLNVVYIAAKSLSITAHFVEQFCFGYPPAYKDWTDTQVTWLIFLSWLSLFLLILMHYWVICSIGLLLGYL